MGAGLCGRSRRVGGVLRLYDIRTGHVEDIRPAHVGELRVLAVTPRVRDEPHLGQLRAWLLPDLIRRCAELRRLVTTSCEITNIAAQAARAALNIHPAERTAPASEPIERTVEFVEPGYRRAGTDGPPPFDIGTGDAGWLGGPELTRHVTAPVGLVTIDGRTVPADDTSAPNLRDAVDRGLDPLAIRLAFLGRRYRDELDLTWDALHAAEKTLLRWRERVAEWALSPSAAMPRRYADAITGAFDDDLDTPAALRELHALEADDSAAAGARFETFAAMDRLLGLDLARDIGRVTAARRP
jgi:hypothetical protein